MSERGSSQCRTKGFWVPALATAFSIGGLWVGYKLFKYVATQRRRQCLLIQYRKEMIPDSAQMEAIKEDFVKQLDYGRENKVTPTGRHMLMLPSYVTALPTGLESGDSYAIDLGGTNMRVLHVVLSEEPSKVVCKECTEMTEVSIPPNIYKGTGQQLFDFLATTLRDFIMEHTNTSMIEAMHLFHDGPALKPYAWIVNQRQKVDDYVVKQLDEVYMVGRDLKKLEAAAAAIRKEIGKSAKLEIIQCDLSNMDDVVQLVDTFKRSGDPLHILINNAGCYFPGPFKLVKGNLEQTMAVNFFAPALLTLSLLDKMQSDGRIVMMSSEGEAMGKVDW
eukprot:CAMPEP_0202363440 /NCGR_PEP_ID=MMETSP1126-20121109/15231_1 /ASSEMBLY_ACC=CAM_ASM_000457 /TAXON_ID=3047 /ORGANISM="Dunaliella tertiolecta, Strain CCMP1320" /LENGTH=332 /DNA_ID=CAMNT_0048957851 /DNA_START=15 /DNA_END=1010 /DNA_ORIENTATION=-